LIVDRKITYQDIKKTIEKLSIPYLEKFELYDCFSGAKIPKNKISLSFRLIYRHPQRTLLAKEVDELQQRIIKNLKSNFKLQLREAGSISKSVKRTNIDVVNKE